MSQALHTKSQGAFLSSTGEILEVTEGILALRCHMPVGWLPGSRKGWWALRAAGGLTNEQPRTYPSPVSFPTPGSFLCRPSITTDGLV